MLSQDVKIFIEPAAIRLDRKQGRLLQKDGLPFLYSC